MTVIYASFLSPEDVAVFEDVFYVMIDPYNVMWVVCDHNGGDTPYVLILQGLGWTP